MTMVTMVTATGMLTAASMPTAAVSALLCGLGGGASTGWWSPHPAPNGAVRAAGARRRWRTRSWPGRWRSGWSLLVVRRLRWECVRRWWCAGARGPRARPAGRWRRAWGLPPLPSESEPLPSSEPRRGCGCGVRCAGASHPPTSGAPRSAGRRAARRRFARSGARPARAAERRGARWPPRPGGPGCRPRLSSGRPRTLRLHRCSPSGPGPRAGCANAGRWATARRYRWRAW